VLPHAVIAVNAADISGKPDEWDVDFGTEKLLEAVEESLFQVSYFRELVGLWESRGQTIEHISDLIHRYYSSFSVIRIPTEGRSSTLLGQMTKLRSILKKSCKWSFRQKMRARMLSNSDELGMFLQAGFDHFSVDLETPFNFVQVSLRANPFPEDIGGIILELATSMQNRDRGMTGDRIFNRLSKVTASCMMLDCIRYRKGLHLE